MVLRTPLEINRAPRVGRVSRKPVHTWNIRAQPWQIQPCLLAPVIPGETLKNAVLQARVVTDPVKNRLIGWWHEYYFYYVPFRAMAIRDDLERMVVDPEFNAQTEGITSNVAVANHYFYGRHGIDWVEQCLNAVVAFDFRKPDYEGVHEIDGLPVVSINRNSWADSLLTNSLVAEWDVPVVDGADADTTLDASEVDLAMQQYELLKLNGLVEMSYEDYLKTYGVRGKAVEEAPEEWNPELIRYIRDWQYPSNTIDPTDGSAASAVSWSVAERIDKDRYFREPGFIFGVTVSRPKIYLGNQEGAAASMLSTIRAWLPKIMENDPTTSMMRFASGSGPLTAGFNPGSGVEDYWVDVRDLFLHGDQFVRGSQAYELPLPASDGNLIYPTAAMYDALFVEQTGTAQHIEQDGLISMVIAGSQRDLSASSHSATLPLG